MSHSASHQREPALDGVGTARGGGDVEGLVVEAADRPVVGDPPGVVAQHPVADPTRLQVVEAVRVQAVEEGAGVRPADDQLAERRDVDQPGALVDGHRLALGIAVVVGPAPVAGPQHVAAELPVTPVDRGALGGLERASRERAHRDRRPRRPRGRQPDVGDRPCRCLGGLPDRRELAHATLARAHRHRRVALQQLERVEALVDRVADVLGRDVLAEAREALAPASALGPGGGRDDLDGGLGAARPGRARSDSSRDRSAASPSSSESAASAPATAPESSAWPRDAWPVTAPAA